MTSKINSNAVKYDVNVGVLTISDRCYRGKAEDISGPHLVTAVLTSLPSNFKAGLLDYSTWHFKLLEFLL